MDVTRKTIRNELRGPKKSDQCPIMRQNDSFFGSCISGSVLSLVSGQDTQESSRFAWREKKKTQNKKTGGGVGRGCGAFAQGEVKT